MEHCIAIIFEIAHRPVGDSRSIFQLGYNLGRLSEITGLGRGPFWDVWKVAVAEWDSAELKRLARELQTSLITPRDRQNEDDEVRI
jgi:hypothetical protein